MKPFSFFIKYLLFWLLYFFLSKAFFLLFNSHLTSDLSTYELYGIFFHGFKMDLSTASYLTVIPGLFLVGAFVSFPKNPAPWLKAYTLILFIPVTLLNIFDMGLYPHWGTRMGISAFDYLEDPGGMVSSITIKDILLVAGIFLFYFVLFRWLFLRFLIQDARGPFPRRWYFAAGMFFCTAFLFLPIRGGLGTSPINKSTVAFSRNLYANQAAANYLWNFVQTIERRESYQNPCRFTSDREAYALFEAMEEQRRPADTVLIRPAGDKSPNVLLIILESFSNKVLASFGGDYDVCPQLDSLSSEGIIFPAFYASGSRSDRGLSALLGGYPSLLSTSIMRFPEKAGKLKMMSDYFNDHQYHTAFYYGGDIDFYNLKSFLLSGGYDQIISRNEFPPEQQNMSSWGVPDGYLFDRLLKDLRKRESPFFTVAYTLSSHVPFDVPAKIIEGTTMEAKFLNSLAYTDRSLGDFIRSFKKTGHWENTLVIITADHGSNNPGLTPVTDPETYRIPLIWTGGVVPEPGVIRRLGGQADLMPTLLDQLQWKREDHMFGHNLFSSPSYAFYMLDLGWGYLTPQGQVFYNQETGKFLNMENTGESSFDLSFAKAYMQVLHADFLSK